MSSSNHQKNAITKKIPPKRKLQPKRVDSLLVSGRGKPQWIARPCLSEVRFQQLWHFQVQRCWIKAIRLFSFAKRPAWKNPSGFLLVPLKSRISKTSSGTHIWWNSGNAHEWWLWRCEKHEGFSIHSSLFRKLPVVSKFQTVAWRCRYVTSNFYVWKTIGESIRWMFGPIWYDLKKVMKIR